jgi:hypothetical protein
MIFLLAVEHYFKIAFLNTPMIFSPRLAQNRGDEMKRTVSLAILLTISFSTATAEESPKWKYYWDKASDYLTMPSIPIPSMPSFSMPDISKLGDAAMARVDALISDVKGSFPALEKMGYEISIIGVQSNPAKLKIRMRSKPFPNLTNTSDVEITPNQNSLAGMLLWSARQAKRIQNEMNFGTAIVDVDLGLQIPKIKMSFLKQKKSDTDITLEDIDLSCIQD